MTLTAYAAYSTLGIINAQNDGAYFVYNSKTANNANCANHVPCQSALKPPPNAEQQHVDIDDKNGWIDLEYNVCQGIKNNANGSSECQGYMGHFGIFFTPKETKISNSSDGSVFLDTHSSGKMFSVLFHSAIGPPPPTPSFPSPSIYQGVIYRGINLSGGEFDSAFNLPFAKDALYFVQKGANTVRIPFKWEYIQPDLTKPIDFTQGNAKKLVDLVGELTHAGIYVILDMHNYLRYPSQMFNGPVIGLNSPATTHLYAQAWASFAEQFKNNDHVFFDLMNEPLADPKLILTNYNAAIIAIRSKGFKNLLLLEGNDWSKMSTWMKENASTFIPTNIHDPDNNYAINVHQYFNDEGGNTATCFDPTILLEKIHFNDFIQWVKANKVRVFLSELGGADNTTCAADINKLLTLIESNPHQENVGGFIGWTAWMGGHAASGFLLDLAPNKNGSEKIQMSAGLDRHLHV